MKTKGRLLVAAPPLVDPNFDRSVVLMLEHNDDGAFGVVLNRPMDTTVAAVLPEWSQQAMWPTVLFAGGPVQEDALIPLARRSGTPGHPSQDHNNGFTALVGDLGTIDLTKSPDTVGPLDALRVFMGYSGWGAGQLEGELELGAWIVVDAAPTDPFSAEPSELWHTVLGRQPGTLGWMRWYPEDVNSN